LSQLRFYSRPAGPRCLLFFGSRCCLLLTLLLQEFCLAPLFGLPFGRLALLFLTRFLGKTLSFRFFGQASLLFFCLSSLFGKAPLFFLSLALSLFCESAFFLNTNSFLLCAQSLLFFKLASFFFREPPFFF